MALCVAVQGGVFVEGQPRPFDPWKDAGKLSGGRDGFAVGQLADGRVVVAGGSHYPFGVVEAGLKTAEIWEPQRNVWSALPSMRWAHGYCSGCLMNDGRFMVSGGVDQKGEPSQKVEAYNPASSEWEPLGELPSACRDHRMCAVPGGVLLATVGGGAMLWDAETDHWHVLTSDSPSRFQPLMLHCENPGDDRGPPTLELPQLEG